VNVVGAAKDPREYVVVPYLSREITLRLLEDNIRAVFPAETSLVSLPCSVSYNWSFYPGSRVFCTCVQAVTYYCAQSIAALKERPGHSVPTIDALYKDILSIVIASQVPYNHSIYAT
jgi:hypothetical protein